MIESKNVDTFHAYEPLGQKTYFWTCVPSEDSNQPADSCSLIAISTGHILDGQECKVSSCEQ